MRFLDSKSDFQFPQIIAIVTFLTDTNKGSSKRAKHYITAIFLFLSKINEICVPRRSLTGAISLYGTDFFKPILLLVKPLT